MLHAPSAPAGSPLGRPRARWAPAGAPPRQALARTLLAGAFGRVTLSHATLDRLEAQMRCHGLDRGPVARAPAGAPPSWWLVLEGRIAVGRAGADGSTVENRMVEPGQWFDLASAWLGTEWIESAVCVAPVILAALPLATLLDCAREDEQLMRGMGQAMAERLRQLTEGRHELATKDVLSRLALWLLRQPRDGDAGASIRLPVQKRSIARQLVMAQATLSRCFRRLVELGCIDVAGYTVTIRDLAKLRMLAGENGVRVPA